MPNTKDLLPTNISTLIVGPPKSGKTYPLRTWPKPIYVFSFDGGFASLAGDDVEYDVFYDTDRYKPQAYMAFMRKLDEKLAALASGACKDKTWAFDNITFLGKHAINHIQHLNRTIDKPLGYDGYRALFDKLSDAVKKAKASGLHIVVTAEDKTDKDEITGEIEVLPSVDGSYREVMASEFDLVVYSKVGRDLKDPKKPKWYWQTVPDHRIKSAGFRWECGLLPEEEPDFNVVLRKIEAKYPHVKKGE